MGNIIDLIFQLLSQLILPNWPDLILLVPWVLVAIMLVFFLSLALQWRRTLGRNRSRVPKPLSGGTPPPGVHLPGPSRWPFVAPIGAAMLLFSFALSPKDAGGNATAPFNIQLFAVGLIVTLIGIAGWLHDAMREWRATAAAGEGMTHGALPAGANAAVALAPGTAVSQRHGAFARAETDVVAEPAYPEPPPGVHMPGPSPWPFFAPIAMVVLLYGVIFSSVLIVGGIILALIAVAGWYLDAGHELRTTEDVGHAVPATRDPYRAWPRRLVPIYAAVIAISFAITVAPIGLSWLNSLTPAAATAAPVTVPAVPQVAAHNVAFDTKTLVVPAGRAFDLTFNNNDAGVPHNVQIDDSPARATTLFDGDVVTGVTTATYHVPALQPGTYYFLCKVHPNMNGTVNAVAQSGGAPAPAGPGSGPTGPGGAASSAGPGPGNVPAGNVGGSSPAPPASQGP
jgi:plastocyanin